MSGRAIDIAGQKFNRLTAIEYVGKSKWLFQCDCGRKVIISAANVKRGNTMSCGCLHKEIATRQVVGYNTIHGKCRTPENLTWNRMLNRCYNPANPKYKNYGGRGITVCERWRGEHGFENFLTDMGERPSSKHSIDRIDVNGNYCPENCRWATAKVQANNMTTNILISYRGKTQTLSQWCDELNLSYSRVYDRYSRGETNPEKLFYPKNTRIREVYQFDSEGTLITTYATQSEAAKALGVSREYVRLCCLHRTVRPRKFNLEYEP